MTAVNEELKTAPDKINQDPHGTWIIKVELADPADWPRCSTPRRMRRLLLKNSEASEAVNK